MASKTVVAGMQQYNRLMADALQGLIRAHGSFESIPGGERRPFTRVKRTDGVISTLIAEPVDLSEALRMLESGSPISSIAVVSIDKSRIRGASVIKVPRTAGEHVEMLKGVFLSEGFKANIAAAYAVQHRYVVESAFCTLQHGPKGALEFHASEYGKEGEPLGLYDAVTMGMINPEVMVTLPDIDGRLLDGYSVLIDGHFHPMGTDAIPSSPDLECLHGYGFSDIYDENPVKMPLGLMPIGIVAVEIGARIRMLVIQEREVLSGNPLDFEAPEPIWCIDRSIKDPRKREEAAIEYLNSVGYTAMIVTAAKNGRISMSNVERMAQAFG